MKNSLLLIATLIGLSACGKSPEDKENPLTKWYGAGMISKEINGKTETQKDFLACRKLSSDQKTHYYFYVSVSNADSGAEVYENASLTITEVKIQPNMTNFYLMKIYDGRLVTEKAGNDVTLFHFLAKDLTLEKGPDGKPDLKDTEKEVLTISDYFGSRNNQTEREVPGLEAGDTLECTK
jgi:hypothetical protein